MKKDGRKYNDRAEQHKWESAQCIWFISNFAKLQKVRLISNDTYISRQKYANCYMGEW